MGCARSVLQSGFIIVIGASICLLAPGMAMAGYVRAFSGFSRLADGQIVLAQADRGLSASSKAAKGDEDNDEDDDKPGAANAKSGDVKPKAPKSGDISIGGALPSSVAAGQPTKQTIVFLRHGEKPDDGRGQLSCRGFNRALALPAVISKMFGRPTAMFAPNPSHQKKDNGEYFNYIRPLATIEPTAIALDQHVNVQFGYKEIGLLEIALNDVRYRNGLIIVAWEHKMIPKLVRKILSDHGADASAAPDWRKHEFDLFYVVTINRTDDKTQASFELKHQGLDGRSDVCPQPQ